MCPGAHSGESFTIDRTFNPGKINYPHWYGSGLSLKMVLQRDQKIILCGAITNVDSRTVDGIVRLNADGSFDSSFQPAVPGGRLFAIAGQSDGKLIYSSRMDGLQRLNADGTRDDTFHGAKEFYTFLQTGPTNEIYIADKVSDTTDHTLRRMSRDGIVETGFAIPGSEGIGTLEIASKGSNSNILTFIKTGAYLYNFRRSRK